MNDEARTTRIGLAFGCACYGLWGLAPVVWKAVDHIPVFEVLAQRILWSIVFLLVMLAMFRAWDELRSVWRSGARLRMLALSAALVSTNWGVFVYGVASGQILAVSLGYFLNPLVNVALGIVFLRERLRPWQAAAVALAAAGMLHMGLQLGTLPWITLALAFSFGFYGLLRKTMPVGSLVGLSVETTLILPVAAGYLIWLETQGGSISLAASWWDWFFLFLTGAVTALPLYWFTQAAKRLRYATIGVLQYIAPSLQFLLAVLAYGEVFTTAHAITFGCIWLALAVYTADSLSAWRSAGRAARAKPEELA